MRLLDKIFMRHKVTPKPGVGGFMARVRRKRLCEKKCS